MTAADRWFDRDAVAPTLGLPAFVAFATFVQGYPVPRSPAALLASVAAGLALATLGLVAWWSYDHGRVVAPAAASLAVAGAVGWSVFAPDVTAVRVGESVVLAEEPVLARFAGVSPWIIITVGVAALIEPARLRGSNGPERTTGGSLDLSRRRSLGLAIAGGAGAALLTVAPAYLVGPGFAEPMLLGFAVGGGFIATTAVGYLFVRHQIVTPLLLLGVVAAAAAISVTAGGSPRGFPTAWPVWFLPGLVLGGFEAVVRYVSGRVGDS